MRTDTDKEIPEDMRRAYCEGMREGVRRFAWWKDGTQYVGFCGTTLDKALQGIDAEESFNRTRGN